MIKGNNDLLVSSLARFGYIYTYMVLDYFSKKYDKVYFICGCDNLKDFKNWKKYDYILKNYKMIAVFLFVLIVGLVGGLIFFNLINENIKLQIIDTMKKTLEISKKEGFTGFNVIKNGMISNILLTGVIYLLALSFICPYLIGSLSLLKGFSIGLYVPTIFYIFGLKNGIIATSLMVVLPNIFYIVSFIYSCTNAHNLNLKLMNKEGTKIMIIAQEIIRIAVSFSFVFLGVFIEQLTSNYVLSLYEKL